MEAKRILAKLRLGEQPTAAEMAWFGAAIGSGEVTDAQAGAFAMCV